MILSLWLTVAKDRLAAEKQSRFILLRFYETQEPSETKTQILEKKIFYVVW